MFLWETWRGTFDVSIVALEGDISLPESARQSRRIPTVGVENDYQHTLACRVSCLSTFQHNYGKAICGLTGCNRGPAPPFWWSGARRRAQCAG